MRESKKCCIIIVLTCLTIFLSCKTLPTVRKKSEFSLEKSKFINDCINPANKELEKTFNSIRKKGESCIDVFDRLSSGESLDLSNAMISDISPLAVFVQLKNINLANNPIDKIEALNNYNQLMQLDIRGTRVLYHDINLLNSITSETKLLHDQYDVDGYNREGFTEKGLNRFGMDKNACFASKYNIVVDIGGTNVKLIAQCIAEHENERIMVEKSKPTVEVFSAKSTVAADLCTYMHSVGIFNVEAAAVGVSGSVSDANGTIKKSYNLGVILGDSLPENYPLRDELHQVCAVKHLTLMNDAELVSRGFAAHNDNEGDLVKINSVIITLGTGVGLNAFNRNGVFTTGVYNIVSNGTLPLEDESMVSWDEYLGKKFFIKYDKHNNRSTIYSKRINTALKALIFDKRNIEILQKNNINISTMTVVLSGGGAKHIDRETALVDIPVSILIYDDMRRAYLGVLNYLVTT